MNRRKVGWYYNTREQRSKWIYERFHKEFSVSTTILDVGCYNKDLKSYLKEKINYTGIDIDGNPDINLDLEHIEKLPFENDSFDTVVCADVLEHLENIHLIFDELCRVSKKYIIITLPNPIYGISRYIFNRTKQASFNEGLHKFGKNLKFYGLPLEKPDDRHKWFYSYEDAVDFIRYRSHRFGFHLTVIENNLLYEKFTFIKKFLLTLIEVINPNFAYRNAIFLLEKSSK
jgi:hypothetical protein